MGFLLFGVVEDNPNNYAFPTICIALHITITEAFRSVYVSGYKDGVQKGIYSLFDFK